VGFVKAGIPIGEGKVINLRQMAADVAQPAKMGRFKPAVSHMPDKFFWQRHDGPDAFVQDVNSNCPSEPQMATSCIEVP
jgi:hypothetical protein